MDNIKTKVSALPQTPGVYLMRNKDGVIIYVGKAKKLKNRVSSYFIKNNQHTAKIKQMVASVVDFDVCLVATEFEALLLECQLIHKFRPPYNQMMNHYEAYGYFELLERAPYIRVIPDWRDKHFCIGPFYKQAKMQEFVQILNSVYRLTGPLRDIEGIVTPYTTHTSPVEKQAEFNARLTEIKTGLAGKHDRLLTRLEQKMNAATTRLDYEQADKWWQSFLTAQRFLRRNKQLLQATNDNLFVGMLSENELTYVYLYGKGQVISQAVYKKVPTAEQALKRLKKLASKKLLRRLAAKEYLSKAEVDIFPIFFHYLNRYGTIKRFDWT
jgi:excinuclease ABC subunit C